MTLSLAQATDWLTRYGRAWIEQSPEQAAALFTEDCRYFETPFDAPAIGREGVRAYWQAVPDAQRDIEFVYRVLSIDGCTAIAHWHAIFTRVASGERVQLDGVFVLEFADSGLCHTLREWWHRQVQPGQ
ncbi:MAG: nuclear transport factor 2 family protein [Betaproteobacteria bacterium]